MALASKFYNFLENRPCEVYLALFQLYSHREYGKPRIYAGADQIPVGLFPDMVIDLRKVLRN